MPHMKVQALTSRWVKRATKPGAYSDGYGLTLKIDARGNKRWIQRVTIRKKQRTWALGLTPRYPWRKHGRGRWPTGVRPRRDGTSSSRSAWPR